MTDQEKLQKLIEKIETSVPYVIATLGIGNRFESERDPDWVEIHGGRADSSLQQLTRLLETARGLK